MSVGNITISRLDQWVNKLAEPFLPAGLVRQDDRRYYKLREETPPAVMVRKLVRSVCGLRGALVLAEKGYVTESAVLLRIVSDLCTEINAIGVAIQRGGDLPTAIKNFVSEYFASRPRDLSQFEEAERRRYVSREELLKFDILRAEGTPVDVENLRTAHRFLNFVFDAYVHGAYETTMELYNPDTEDFIMREHPMIEKRKEFIKFVFLKMHEVVCAIVLTSTITANEDVFREAQEARRIMDMSDPWKQPDGDSFL